MKITPEHLETMRSLLRPVVARTPIAEYRAANPGFSEKRIRWDYWHATGREGLSFLCDVIYKYANDDHFDTALRHLVAEFDAMVRKPTRPTLAKDNWDRFINYREGLR